MPTKNLIARVCRLLLPALLLSVCFCAESEEMIRKKLAIILADDLEAILEDVDKEALLDEPYFELVEYAKYKEGDFTRRAVVDFYFLKTVDFKITRKYRYQRYLGLWDRYYNKYYKFDRADGGGADEAEN